MTLDELVKFIKEYRNEAWSEEQEAKATLGRSYNRNSYGAGYNYGMIQACDDILEILARTYPM